MNTETVRLTYYTTTKPGADGAFRFGGVPPGKYTLHPNLGATLPYFADPTAPFEVKSGETADVSLPLQPARVVTGRVVAEQGGAGVAGADVWVSLIDKGKGGVTHDYGTISLRRVGGEVAGRVVDGAGRPSPGCASSTPATARAPSRRRPTPTAASA